MSTDTTLGAAVARVPSWRGMTLEQRFAASYRVDEATGCWLWTAWCGTGGYGIFGASWNGKHQRRRAHRVSYEIHKGAIPEGLYVCHICDVRSCVNPDHLFLGTATDNNHDRDRKGRHACQHKNKTHCVRGHALSGDNLTIASDGSRRCRTCDRARSRSYRKVRSQVVRRIASEMSVPEFGVKMAPHSYVIVLHRMIETAARGEVIPSDLAEKSPHMATLLNNLTRTRTGGPTDGQ